MTDQAGREDRPSAVIRFEFDPQETTLGRVIRAEEAFLSVVREVARRVIDVNVDPVRFVLEGVEGGSVAFRLRPEPAIKHVSRRRMPEVADAIASGLATIEAEPKRPPFFSDLALERARELADLTGEELPNMRVRNGRERADLTKQLVANVDALLGRPVLSIGSIEGTLEGLTVHDRRSFNVYDPLTGERIECHFGHRIDVEEIARAIERRVAVHGEIRYRPTGELLSVRAEELEVFPPSTDLPTADDVRGLLRER